MAASGAATLLTYLTVDDTVAIYRSSLDKMASSGLSQNTKVLGDSRVIDLLCSGCTVRCRAFDISRDWCRCSESHHFRGSELILSGLGAECISVQQAVNVCTTQV